MTVCHAIRHPSADSTPGSVRAVPRSSTRPSGKPWN
jgi:hypothetical protein